MRLHFLPLILPFLVVSSSVWANEVSLKWDPVEIPQVEGLILEYEVCYSFTGPTNDFNTCQVVAADNQDMQGNSPGLHVTDLDCDPIWWKVRSLVRRVGSALPPTPSIAWSNVVNDYPTVEGQGQPYCGPVPSDVTGLERSDAVAAADGG